MKALAVGIRRFLREEEGVTMVEYGLIAALIAIVCIIFITNVGTNLNLTFGEICNRLKNALGTANVNGAVTC